MSFAVVALVVVGLTIAFEDSVIGLEEDIVELFGFLTPSIERVLHGALEVVSLAVPRKRWHAEFNN